MVGTIYIFASLLSRLIEDHRKYLVITSVANGDDVFWFKDMKKIWLLRWYVVEKGEAF